MSSVNLDCEIVYREMKFDKLTLSTSDDYKDRQNRYVLFGKDIKYKNKWQKAGKKVVEIDLSNTRTTIGRDLLKNFPHLTSINYSNNNINRLTPRISELTHLRELNLSGNRISTLPSSLKLLKSLKIICLDKNSFCCVPKELGEISSLEYVSLANNNLTFLSNSLTKLSQLKCLDLSLNKLTSLPGTFGNLSNLHFLNLRLNYLKNLPLSLENLQCLAHLDVGHNQLTELPSEFASHLTLKYLSVDNNQITDLPNWINNLPNLEYLDTSFNKFLKCPFKEEFGLHNQNLIKVTWTQCGIDKIPSSTSFQQSVEYIFLGNNENIDYEEQVDEIREIGSGKLNVIKDLPESFGSVMSNLKHLTIENVKLESLPNLFGKGLKNVQALYLKQNLLSFLPKSIGQMENLTYCDFSHNKLVNLPYSFGQLERLEHLFLQYNRISSLPPSFMNLQKLHTLDIYSNYFTKLPSLLARLSHLTSLGTELKPDDMLLDATHLTYDMFGEPFINSAVLEGVKLRTESEIKRLGQKRKRSFVSDISTAKFVNPCSSSSQESDETNTDVESLWSNDNNDVDHLNEIFDPSEMRSKQRPKQFRLFDFGSLPAYYGSKIYGSPYPKRLRFNKGKVYFCKSQFSPAD